MRISIVLLLCLVIVVVNSATSKTTRSRLVVTAGRTTTKAPVPKSAYAYLRSVRGKNSCAGGSCPFWERHGRSFAALRCYSQQYQECTCLHRMCFSSCMFTRHICNQEMVSCLRQICPRCMPVSASAMCAVYDSMAERVAEALSVFACYPCCPNNVNVGTINSSNGQTASGTTTPFSGSSTTLPPDTEEPVDPTATIFPEEYIIDEFNQPGSNINGALPGNNQNGGNVNGGFTNGGNTNSGNINGGNQNSGNTNGGNINGGNTNGAGQNGGNINGGSQNGGNTNSAGQNGGNINGAGQNGGNINGGSQNGGNTNGAGQNGGNINGGSQNGGNINGGITNGGAFNNGNGNGFSNVNGITNGNGNGFSNVNGITNGNNGFSNGNSNGNGNGNGNVANNYPGVVFPGSDAMFYNNNFPNHNKQVIKQRVRQTVRTTKRRLATTRRTPTTTRRMAQTTVTVRGNNVKNGVRKPVQAQKKPQTNNRINS